MPIYGGLVYILRDLIPKYMNAFIGLEKVLIFDIILAISFK